MKIAIRSLQPSESVWEPVSLISLEQTDVMIWQATFNVKDVVESKEIAASTINNEYVRLDWALIQLQPANELSPKRALILAQSEAANRLSLLRFPDFRSAIIYAPSNLSSFIRIPILDTTDMTVRLS